MGLKYNCWHLYAEYVVTIVLYYDLEFWVLYTLDSIHFAPMLKNISHF